MTTERGSIEIVNGVVGPRPQVCLCPPGEETPVRVWFRGEDALACAECLQTLPPYNDRQAPPQP